MKEAPHGEAGQRTFRNGGIVQTPGSVAGTEPPAGPVRAVGHAGGAGRRCGFCSFPASGYSRCAGVRLETALYKTGACAAAQCTCKMKVDTHKSVGVYFFRSTIREKGGIGMGKKGTPHRKWSKEEKLYYIHLHLDEHLSVMEIERRHGVRNSLVSAWVKRYLEEGEDALEPKNGNPYAALHTSKTLSEVDRLRLIIAKQEVEIARLKKGYWVEGVGAKKEYVTGSGKNTKSSKN